VAGRRADGFHDIHSVVAKVTLYDELTVRPRGDGRVGFSCSGADCGPDERNLARRAALLLHDRAAERAAGAPGADVALAKRIPPGAGLGGGSSDAAAVLAGLNELWRLGLTPEELSAAAAELGSDVPLFLGGPCSRMTGRGERLEPLAVHDFRAVLIVPEASCRTEEVYRAYDAISAERAPAPPTDLDVERLAAEPPSRWRQLLRNDLAPAAREVSPAFDEAFARLSAAVSRPVHVSGSGSAMFILCDGEAEAAGAAAGLPAALRERAVIVAPNPW
jgi:4-diphosphocytidyl-2-C-methyl-D-erythritol kinase